MNLVVVPFHDWRKGLQEGFRDRDLHFIQHLLQHNDVEKVLIVNRPITQAEVLIRHTTWKTPGDILLENRDSRLVQVHNKGYVLDCLLNQSLQQIVLRRKWYFSAFSSRQIMAAVHDARKFLDVKEFIGFSNTVFAAGFFEKMNSMSGCVFDADDNWLKFPHYKPIRTDLYRAYMAYAKFASLWVTNSETNQEKFKEQFDVGQICVIKNAVDKESFQRKYPVPEDLAGIGHPIIGFGGRINHLMDVDLVNSVVSQNRDKNFVVIGQAMDKKVLKVINEHPNLYYLGDKHYSQYPAYITHFDVCIMPYVVGTRAHGGNAIKVYEYIAAGKPVVATNGNGAEDLTEYVTIASNPQQFSEAIDASLSMPNSHREIPDEFTWKFKTDVLVNLFRQFI